MQCTTTSSTTCKGGFVDIVLVPCLGLCFCNKTMPDPTPPTWHEAPSQNLSGRLSHTHPTVETLSPSNHHVFWHPKKALHGKHFTQFEDVKEGCPSVAMGNHECSTLQASRWFIWFSSLMNYVIKKKTKKTPNYSMCPCGLNKELWRAKWHNLMTSS